MVNPKNGALNWRSVWVSFTAFLDNLNPDYAKELRLREDNAVLTERTEEKRKALVNILILNLYTLFIPS
jgi:hypothetical protein